MRNFEVDWGYTTVPIEEQRKAFRAMAYGLSLRGFTKARAVEITRTETEEEL